MKELISVAEQIATELKARKQTIAVAETSAGGLVSAALLAVPGASVYYFGGGVIYTREARRILMDISDDTMRSGKYRSSSEPYAVLLADQIRARFGTHWGLSETGAAGPGGNRYGDASGHTCIAVSGSLSSVMTLETGNDDRLDNMFVFARTTLEECLKAIRAQG